MIASVRVAKAAWVANESRSRSSPSLKVAVWHAQTVSWCALI